MQLDRDFSEFVGLLAAHDVRSMIVGGYALAAHGLPRATGDLDAWIWPDPDNARRMLEVLDEFGFGELAITDTTRVGFIIDSLDAPAHTGADRAARHLAELLDSHLVRIIDRTTH